MLYFHHPSSLEHDPTVHSPGHPDAPERIGAIEAAIQRLGWLGCEVREAQAATKSELRLVHSARQVTTIHDLCAAGGGQIDVDTYVGEASYEAALHAAGGACDLVRALVRGEDRVGFSALRPSGHHAGHDYAMGFCLFNNVAIATELAIRELGVEPGPDHRLGRTPRQRDGAHLPPSFRRAVREHPSARAVPGDGRGG